MASPITFAFTYLSSSYKIRSGYSPGCKSLSFSRNIFSEGFAFTSISQALFFLSIRISTPSI